MFNTYEQYLQNLDKYKKEQSFTKQIQRENLFITYKFYGLQTKPENSFSIIKVELYCLLLGGLTDISDAYSDKAETSIKNIILNDLEIEGLT